jgi:hypothetical protein
MRRRGVQNPSRLVNRNKSGKCALTIFSCQDLSENIELDSRLKPHSPTAGFARRGGFVAHGEMNEGNNAKAVSASMMGSGAAPS